MASFLEIPQLQYLLELVGKEFGRSVATTTDFEILSIDIERKTGDHISSSTLKRMWGYVKMHPVPRIATLDVLSRYIGFKSFKEFCQSLRSGDNALDSGFFGAVCISAKDLQKGQRVRLGWAPDRMVELLYLGDFTFEVQESRNTKLLPGDRFELSDIITGCPLCISRILRGGKYTRPYMAAIKDGLNLVEII